MPLPTEIDEPPDSPIPPLPALALFPAVSMLVSLSLLYRFGLCRAAARWRWVTPGSTLAATPWGLASVLFSYCVGQLATYGPLAVVLGMMMWFFVTVYVVLPGGELNAALE